MERYLLGGLGIACLYSYAIYCWHNLIGEKVNFKSLKLYFAWLLATFLGTCINFMVPQFLKIVFYIVMLFLINYVFFCKKLDRCIAAVIVSEFIVMICETVLSFSISLLGEDAQLIAKGVWGFMLINIVVSVMAILVLFTPLPKKIYKYLVKIFNDMKNNSLLLCLAVTILLANVFMALSYMNVPSFIVLVVNTLLIVIYSVIVIKLMGAQENLKRVNSKYETSLSSLREYEGVMDRYRISNHENKNQLLTIRNMINPKEKKVINYIDTIVDNKLQDNEILFYKTAKIPEGGLRATIYSGLCKMDEKQIHYVLDIANDVKVADLIDLNDNTMLSACKVLGVFLDNAVEAVESLDEKNIIVEVFIMDDYLCVDISNNYSGKIEMDKLDKAKYTTKGYGHGYGLTLASELISNDDLLENEKLISKEMFTQRLKIKMVKNVIKKEQEKNVES